MATSRQTRRLLKKGVGGNPNARTNHAALVLALGRYAIERGRRAEIHHDAGPAEFLESRHRIHDAIGADFRGIVVKHRHASLDSRFDEKRLGAEITFADLAQSGIDRRHHGRDNDAVDALDFNLVHGKQVAEEHAVFVHRLSCDRRHAPVRHQSLIRQGGCAAIGLSFGEDTEHRIRVADVKNKKHG